MLQMPARREENDFELTYVSPEKKTYRSFKEGNKGYKKVPVPPPRRSLEQLDQVGRTSPMRPISTDHSRTESPIIYHGRNPTYQANTSPGRSENTAYVSPSNYVEPAAYAQPHSTVSRKYISFCSGIIKFFV